MKIRLTINNRKKSFEVPANRTLMDLLRSNGFWSVKQGCENGDCGNCTIIVDGLAVNSCLMLAVQADGKRVETFEGIRDEKELSGIKEALMDFGDIDCGYCIPSMVMSLKALLDRIPDPTEEELVDALNGNLCRCTQSVKPIRALLAAIKKRQGEW
ncbi:MAG: (2Fe-2S)-binding protein [bacterium]